MSITSATGSGSTAPGRRSAPSRSATFRWRSDVALEPMTAKGVLVGVLRKEGAEAAAHETICREEHEAESMERLSAEYLTLATEAQAERWDALLARSGLSDADLATVAASAGPGPTVRGIARRRSTRTRR
jgi:hypothetical protein